MPPVIKIVNADAASQAMRQQLLHAVRTQPTLVNGNQPPAYVPLVDQIRSVLAAWPPAMQNKVSLDLLLPHLQGRYRELPNRVGVSRALRQLGYTRTRSYKATDGGCRFWIKNPNQ